MVGNFNGWDTKKAIKLNTSPNRYPLWESKLVFFTDKHIEYKYVVLKTNTQVIWEDGDNRKAKLEQKIESVT